MLIARHAKPRVRRRSGSNGSAEKARFSGPELPKSALLVQQPDWLKFKLEVEGEVLTHIAEIRSISVVKVSVETKNSDVSRICFSIVAPDWSVRSGVLL